MDRDTIIENLRAAIDTCDVDLAAITSERARFVAALELLHGDVEGVTAAAAVTPTPTPAPEPKVSLPKVVRKPGPPPGAARAGTVDYTAIAELVNARRPDQSMRDAVLAAHDVPTTTVNNWIYKCRGLGLIVDRATDGAITPNEIRHAVEAIPADRRIEHDPNAIEPIRGPHGFTGHKPAPPPATPQTERHGWKPGMAAELLGATQ